MQVVMIERIDADLIKCRQLVLSASDGEPRIMAHVTEDGQAALALYDLAGRMRTTVFVGAGGEGHVALFDDAGRARIDIAQAGSPAITLRDAQDVPRLILTLAGESPTVLACDADGVPLEPMAEVHT